MSEDPGAKRRKEIESCKGNIEYVHVDQNNAQGPYIGGTGLIHGGHVVSALCEGECKDKALEREIKEDSEP